MRTGSRYAARFALIAFAIALPLLLFEVVLRLQGYQAFQWSDRVNVQLITATDNPELPYVLTPNADGWGWETHVTMNSHGFRDREFTEKKGDRFRIIAIGDSITFGSRLSPPSVLYPKQLERLLQSRPSTSQVEVLNFGVTGYDVVNDVEHLRVRALKFQPDIVLLGFCVNDIGTSSTAMGYVRAAKYLAHPVFRFRAAQFALGTGLKRWATVQSNNDQNVDVFRATNGARILPLDDDPGLLRLIDDVAKTAAGSAGSGLIQWWTQPARIGFLEYGFKNLRTLRERYGFAVVVVAVPSLDERRKSAWRIVNEIIRHESEKFGFHFVDVFDEFEEAGLRKLRNEPNDDIHPGIKGHAIMARRIEESLVSSGLLK